MKTLDEIFIEHGTDKASKHLELKGHNYAPGYEVFFAPRRFDPLKLLEIGVGGGESVKSWLEYFASASIYGIDIVHDTNPYNTPDAIPGIDPRYRFLQGDQSDKTMWACALANWGDEFDIIIDDGSHINTDIIASFDALWPIVNPGGLYCVEDLNAGYTPGSVHVKPGAKTHAQWLHDFIDRIHTAAGDLDSIYFAPELAILRKRA